MPVNDLNEERQLCGVLLKLKQEKPGAILSYRGTLGTTFGVLIGATFGWATFPVFASLSCEAVVVARLADQGVVTFSILGHSGCLGFAL